MLNLPEILPQLVRKMMEETRKNIPPSAIMNHYSSRYWKTITCHTRTRRVSNFFKKIRQKPKSMIYIILTDSPNFFMKNLRIGLFVDGF